MRPLELRWSRQFLKSQQDKGTTMGVSGFGLTVKGCEQTEHLTCDTKGVLSNNQRCPARTNPKADRAEVFATGDQIKARHSLRKRTPIWVTRVSDG